MAVFINTNRRICQEQLIILIKKSNKQKFVKELTIFIFLVFLFTYSNKMGANQRILMYFK